jgi:hypothetical protein
VRGRFAGGALIAFVAAAAAACAGRGAEVVERPRASGPTPEEQARRNRYQLELEGMSAYHGLDPRQHAAATPASVQEIMPTSPVVLPPVRPRLRGDALVLADLALDRGDPLDAAAQLRAWIGGRDPATTGYANVRLADAYLALGQIDRATAALTSAVRAPDTEWYALTRLADLRVPEFGALAVTRQLTLMAPSRANDIEDYIIARAPRADVDELLVRKVERAPNTEASCGFAIAAVTHGARRIPHGVSERCRIEVARAIHAATGEPWLDERNPARRALEANRASWFTLLSSPAQTPGAWLAIAERYVEAKALATTPADSELASRSAGTALVNVLRVAWAGPRLSDDDRRRFDAVADALAPDDRKRITYLLRTQPVHAPRPQPEAP